MINGCRFLSGKSCIDTNSNKNYLMFQPNYKYFKTFVNGTTIFHGILKSCQKESLDIFIGTVIMVLDLIYVHFVHF